MVIQWGKTEKGGPNSEIRQIFGNFSGKLHIWKHFWQKLNKDKKKKKKPIENFDEMSKEGIIRWEIVKNWLWIIQKKGSLGTCESESKKGVSVATHSCHQFLASVPLPPGPVACAFALLILPRTFIWKHTDTPRTLHLPRTQKRVLGKRWLKTPKTSCFTILGGSALRGPQRTSNLTLYMRTYESSEV